MKHRPLQRLLIMSGVTILLAPLLVVMAASFGDTAYLRFPPSGHSWRAYRQLATDTEWRVSVVNSAAIALAVALSATLLALACGLAFITSGLPGRTVMLAMLVVTALLPPTILAVGFTLLAGGLHFLDTYVMLVTAHLAIATPPVALLMISVISRDHAKFEVIATGMGAPQLLVLLRVFCPRFRQVLAVSAFLGFVSSFDEFVMSLYLTGPRTQTLPPRMWAALRYDIDPAVGAVGTVMFIISIGAPLLLQGIRPHISHELE